MLTRIEIDGFKSFEEFSLDLRPLTAIVGANASGKSNLFDAIRFISLLAQHDIRTAMQDLRGLPEELFRETVDGRKDRITFGVEVLLSKHGTDAFGKPFEIFSQRLRYELSLKLSMGSDGQPRGVTVEREACYPLKRSEDRAAKWLPKGISYNSNASAFIRISQEGDAIEVRQDGRQKHGRPSKYSLKEASRTALSTITTAELPHLYALRSYFSKIDFLEINPKAARSANDIFEDRYLRSDASNLAATLARLKEETSDELRPDGVLSDIAVDLSALIPSVRRIALVNDPLQRQYAFALEFSDFLSFSSRIISDGTLRLLALLTELNDPERNGTLCFEEPENGVHQGRVPVLMRILRSSVLNTDANDDNLFQVLLNTHSPVVMENLHDHEIVAADMVFDVDPGRRTKTNRTRMRTGIAPIEDMFDPEHHLTRAEINQLLNSLSDAA